MQHDNYVEAGIDNVQKYKSSKLKMRMHNLGQ